MKEEVLKEIESNESKMFSYIVNASKRNPNLIIEILNRNLLLLSELDLDNEILLKKTYITSMLSKEYKRKDDYEKSELYLIESLNMIEQDMKYIQNEDFFELYLNLKKEINLSFDYKTSSNDLFKLIKEIVDFINDDKTSEIMKISLKTHFIYFLNKLSTLYFNNEKLFKKNFVPLYKNTTFIKKDNFNIDDYKEAKMKFQYLKNSNKLNDIIKLEKNLSEIENCYTNPDLFFLNIQINFHLIKISDNKNDFKFHALNNLNSIYTKSIIDRYSENFLFIRYFIEFLILDINISLSKTKDIDFIISKYDDFKFYIFKFSPIFSTKENVRYYDFQEKVGNFIKKQQNIKEF